MPFIHERTWLRLFFLLFRKAMEEAWVTFHLHNRSCNLFGFGVIGVETNRLFVCTSKYNEVLMSANSNSLWIRNFHSLYNRHGLLFQINCNWHICKTDIRVAHSVRIEAKRGGIRISYSLTSIEYGAQKISMCC